MVSLYLKKTNFGTSTFANKEFFVGDKVVQFIGNFFRRSEIPTKFETPEDDRYTQVDTDLFMGPSGGFEDFCDHSCDPNCGLKFLDEGLWLVAIKKIKKHDKITWDYSTMMQNEKNYEFDCECGEQNCRGRVKDFKFLDEKIKNNYISLGIVGPFILKVNK